MSTDRNTTRTASHASPLARPARLLATTVLLALAAGAWQVASAAPGMPGHGGAGMGGPGMDGPGWAMAGPRGIERALDKINATAEQRTQIQQIVSAARTDSQPLRAQAKALHQQGQALFSQTNVDARAAEAQRQQMLALHDQISKRRLQVMLDISRVLTPEQRAKMAELMNQRHAMMERRGAASAPVAK